MNKKTVSILLIIVVSIAITLFSFTSCKNEPKLEPTAAPEPGYVPEVPNNVTPLSKIGEDDLEAINTLGEGLGRFFADYTTTSTGTGTKSGKYKTSLESILEAKLTLSKPISISAPDGEGSFRDKAFTYSDLTGEIDYVPVNPNTPDDKSFFLFVEGKVTSEVFGEGEHTVKLKYDLMETDPYYFYLDGSETPVFSVDWFDHGVNRYYYYPDGNDYLSEGDRLTEVKKKTDLLMFIGYKALAEATVEIEDLQAEMKVDNDNILAAGITGLIQLSGEPLEKIDEDDIDFLDDPVVDLFKSFTATAPDLTVTATLSTKAGNDTDGYETERLSATLSLSNLSLGTIYGNLGNDSKDDDEDLTTVSLEKLALSAWNKDDSVILSLELSNFNLSAEMSLSPRINLSMTLGLGIKVDDNSVGLVADFELTSGKTIGLPFVNFYPKAAVINGSYYEPEGITDSLYDYLDMVISAISKYMIRID